MPTLTTLRRLSSARKDVATGPSLVSPLEILQHAVRIQDAVRVERGLEALHDGELSRAARVVQILAAQRADAVLGGHRAAVAAYGCVDRVAQRAQVARRVRR